MTDPIDQDIRDVIAAEREQAPLPLTWSEVLERHDRGRARSRRPALLAAAAIVAIGLLALIATTALRGGDAVPAEQPLEQTTIPSSTAVPVDALADLNETDWVVPADPPAGYPLLVASVGRPGENSQSQTYGTPHDPGNVHVQVTGGNPYDGAGESARIGGVTWRLLENGSMDGVGDSLTIYRTANRRVVSLSTIGGIDVLVQFASTLVAVPNDQIEFEPLDPTAPLTEVATLVFDEAELSYQVAGSNGYYCWLIEEARTGSGASSAACQGATTPDHPVVVMGGLGGPDGGYSVGLAEPDIVTLEIETATGETIQVAPVDESGQFDQGFWIAATTSSDSLYDARSITAHYGDGSTVILQPAFGGAWRVPAGG